MTLGVGIRAIQIKKRGQIGQKTRLIGRTAIIRVKEYNWNDNEKVGVQCLSGEAKRAKTFSEYKRLNVMPMTNHKGTAQTINADR